jgi:hypothetical protein
MTTKEILLVALLLVLASVVLYGLHYAIFHDAHHIFIYLAGDIAFLPLEVLLVSLIVDRLLAAREVRSRQHKMNMVIGAFFSAVGRNLLRAMAELTADQTEISAHVAVGQGWTEGQIRQAIAWARSRTFQVKPDPAGLARLRDLLVQHRDFMLRLLENPLLLEHEAFSDLLWAAFHLEEELSARESLPASPPPDLDHLAVDAERVYTHLLTQWLEYTIHLRRSYPFLFSFAVRTDPLNADARAEVA